MIINIFGKRQGENLLLSFFYVRMLSRVLLIFCFCFVFVNVSADVPIRKNAVKITFLSWITGSSKVSYERAVFGNQTMEMTAGYIAAGYDKFRNNPEGFTVRYAHKFMLLGNEIHPLNGLYLRPEAIYSHFRYDAKDLSERKLSNMGSLVFTAGYQYIINRFVLDAYLGGGYALGNECDTHYQHGFSLWEYLGTYNKNIAMTFGVKVGLCF